MKNLLRNSTIFLAGLLGLLTGHPEAQAQSTVTGRVVDQQKQTGVSYATVVLKAGDQVVLSTLTDETGAFRLTGIRPQAYRLNVLMLGFAPYAQDLPLVAGAPPLTLVPLPLQAAAQNLTEVVVTGQRPLLEQKPDRVTMNIDGSMLAAGNDAFSILAMAPSVQIREGQLTFRGKPGALVLLNGKRLPGTTLESVLASIPGDQIERIELISNPSAKYDADAAGGVIEIYTKRSKEWGWNANLGGNVSQGFRTAEGLNGGWRTSSPKLDLTASASFTNRDGRERGYENRVLYDGRAPAGSLYQNNSFLTTVRSGSLNGSLSYHLTDQSTLGLDIQQVRSTLDGQGVLSALINQPAGLITSRSANDLGLQVNLASYNLFYQRNFDKLGSGLLVASNYARYGNNQQQTFDQQLQSPGAGPPTSLVFHNSAPATYNIYTGAVDYTRVWNAATRLESGLKYTSTDNASRQDAQVLTAAGWQDQPGTPYARLGYQERVGAGYLNLHHTRGKLAVQLGLRAEQTHYSVVGGIDSAYFNLFPNLRADYQRSKDYTISLAYAKNINRPAYGNLIPYELFLNNYTSRRGNARLQPEYAHSFSWNNLYKGFGLQLEYTQTTNAISTVYLYNPATLRFILTQQNLRARHLATANLTAPVQPAKWWTMSNTASLLYQALSFPDPLQESQIVTKDKLYYTVSSDNTFALGKGWTAQFYGEYNSASFNGLLDYGVYSYTRLGLKKSLLEKRASLKLEVLDLFYKSNVLISSNVVPVVTESLNQNDTRRVRLSFTYKFGKADLKSKAVNSKSNAAELNRLGN